MRAVPHHRRQLRTVFRDRHPPGRDRLPLLSRPGHGALRRTATHQHDHDRRLARSNHIPIGSLDCNGSGCHTTTNVNPGGFKLGAASVAAPTLTVAGHTTVAAVGCLLDLPRERALPRDAGRHRGHVGRLAPHGVRLEAPHRGRLQHLPHDHADLRQQSDCRQQAPNHIPTSAPCAQCHTTAGNNALYSFPGTHQGVTGCLTCHGPTVNTTFINVTMVTTPGNHIPIGSLDCNGSGCHTTANVTPGGRLQARYREHLESDAHGRGPCDSGGGGRLCDLSPDRHWGGRALRRDDREHQHHGRRLAPLEPLDAKHPTTPDCGTCHVTTPTFASDLLPTAPKPSNHIPTTASCAQCHTTAGNFAVYSSPARTRA